MSKFSNSDRKPQLPKEELLESALISWNQEISKLRSGLGVLAT